MSVGITHISNVVPASILLSSSPSSALFCALRIARWLRRFTDSSSDFVVSYLFLLAGLLPPYAAFSSVALSLYVIFSLSLSLIWRTRDFLFHQPC